MNITLHADLDHLDTVVEALQTHIPPNAVIFLRGDLAAGKTTLMQAIARTQGIEGEATSPTFSLQNQYADDLFHYDLYRIDLAELAGLGLLEAFEEPGWHVVEWGSEELAEILQGAGISLYAVSITPEGEARRYELSGYA